MTIRRATNYSQGVGDKAPEGGLKPEGGQVVTGCPSYDESRRDY